MSYPNNSNLNNREQHWQRNNMANAFPPKFSEDVNMEEDYDSNSGAVRIEAPLPDIGKMLAEYDRSVYAREAFFKDRDGRKLTKSEFKMLMDDASAANDPGFRRFRDHFEKFDDYYDENFSSRNLHNYAPKRQDSRNGGGPGSPKTPPRSRNTFQSHTNASSSGPGGMGVTWPYPVSPPRPSPSTPRTLKPGDTLAIYKKKDEKARK